jgi:hypothetical protein
MSTAGTYSITVQYAEDGTTQNATIQITVVAESNNEKDYKWVIGHSITATSDYLQHTPKAYPKRATCLTDAPNEAYVNDTDGSILGYLIPVPSSATKVTVTTPSYVTGIALWDSTLKRVVDAGWGLTSVNELEFTAGTYAYLSVNAKKENDATISTSTDTTAWTVEFS